MAEKNGMAHNGMGQDETVDQVLAEAEGRASGKASTGASQQIVQAVASGGQFGLKLVPFVPVSFTSDPAMAWGRLLLYGVGAALTYDKMRKTSYILMGAAGVSLATSLGIGAVKQ